MKKGLITGTALLLALGATAAQAHDPVAQRVERLTGMLELTEEQQAEVRSIYAEAQEQNKALRAEQKEMRKQAIEQRKAMRERSSEIRQTTSDRIAGVLTQEQNAELAEMRDEIQKRAVMRRGMDRRRGMDQRRGWQGKREMLRRMYRQRQSHEEAAAPEAEE